MASMDLSFREGGGVKKGGEDFLPLISMSGVLPLDYKDDDWDNEDKKDNGTDDCSCNNSSVALRESFWNITWWFNVAREAKGEVEARFPYELKKRIYSTSQNTDNIKPQWVCWVFIHNSGKIQVKKVNYNKTTQLYFHCVTVQRDWDCNSQSSANIGQDEACNI